MPVTDADRYSWVQGAVDTHLHSSPDILPRSQDDLEIARAAAEAGMAAIVLKSHHLATAARAVLVDKHVEGVRILGGLVLNRASAGGLNADAVRANLGVGGKVIWLPTVSAANHQAYLGQRDTDQHLRALSQASAMVPVVDEGGKVLPELEPILDLIAEADAVLATGHLSSAEIVTIVNRALDAGVRRILVTHPEAEMVDLDLSAQRDLADHGVMFERCYYSVLNGLEPEKMLESIRTVGVDSTVLATDLGQYFNAPVPDGLAEYAAILKAAGLTEDEWRAMSATNPRRLLGV